MLAIFTYDTFAALLVSRETILDARFFGMVLHADFIIFDSATRNAGVITALSPESIALTAFLVYVLTWERRAVLTAFFFSVTKMRFLDDL
jgi:hypothetical protein